VSSERVAVVCEAVRCACRLDVIAFKPGNVSFDAAGHDMEAADFLAAAAHTAPALAQDGTPLGTAIFNAVAASVRATGCNTNLGIVLLAAPLAHAALRRRDEESLHASLVRVLNGLTVDDATQVFAAIRIAQPAGLGHSAEHDVATPPEVSLLAAMQFAAVRDRIAFQYAHGFTDVFEFGLPLLRAYRQRWQSLAWAAVGVYLALLGRIPDTHIMRKFGPDTAHSVSATAGALASAFKACENPATFAPELKKFDRELKQNGVNPGTSADLTVACLIALLVEHA
jgi:triphosphoribosyl-dephospho-CoA synthase